MSIKQLFFLAFLVPYATGFATEFPFLQPDEEKEDLASDEPDSGNWYEKLQWWRKAKPAYEAIQGKIAQLKSLTEAFLDRRSTIKKELDAFYNSLRIRQKTTQEMIDKALEEIKTTQEEQQTTVEELSAEQRAQHIELADQQKNLEQLKVDIDMLGSLGNHIEEAEKVASEQLKKAERFEERALESFEKIENVLDDQRAKQLYDIIENSTENIQALIAYIEGPLRAYLEQTAGRATQLMPKIKAMVENLEKHGIPLRVLTEEEKKKEEELKKKQALEEETRIREQKAKKAQAERERAMSWWQKLWNSLVSAVSSLWNTVKNFFGSFFASRPEEKRVPGKERSVPQS